MFNVNRILLWQENGYIYCGENEIEHWNGHIYDHDLRGELQMLKDRCAHLLNLGIVPTTGSVVWFWDWYKDMKPDTPYRDIMHRRPGCIYVKYSEIAFVIHGGIVHWNRTNCDGWYEKLDWDEYWEKTGRVYHHVLVNDRGYQTADVGQYMAHLGTVYGNTEGVVELLKTYEVSEDLFVILVGEDKFNCKEMIDKVIASAVMKWSKKNEPR
jgi:hypothetical protein